MKKTEQPDVHDIAAPRPQRGIQSVEVAGKLLQALAKARRPLNLGELAAASAMTSAQVFTYLVTLAKLGLIKRTAQLITYEPGPLALRLGLRHLQQQAAYRIAVRHARALAASTGQSVAICTLGPQGPTIVHYENSGMPLHVNLHIGTLMSLPLTSTGRVFSAFLLPQKVQEILEMQNVSDHDPFQARKRNLSLRQEEFETILAAIRKRGIERSIDLPSPGISSFSAPVFDSDEQPCLALTLIGATKTLNTSWQSPAALALRAAATAVTQALRGTTPGIGENDAGDESGNQTPTWHHWLAAPWHDVLRDDSEEKNQRGIQSLENSGLLLHAASMARQELSLRDLSTAGLMSTTKAFPHLVSLTKTGLLARTAHSGMFSPGPLSLELALLALQRLDPVKEAELEIAALATKTGLTVVLALMGPSGPTIMRLEESPHPLHINLRMGTVMSLVHTTIGRVFSAFLPEQVVLELMPHDALRLAGDAGATTAVTKTFAKKLHAIRERGIDHAIDQPIPGIHALAAPVFDHTGHIRLCLALIGPGDGFDADLDGIMAQQLKKVAAVLSYKFGYMQN